MTEPRFSFEKLELYQHARAFRKRIYKLSKLLPKDEYKLKVQMRDAARSLTNNIAEGHGRFTFKDRKRFMTDSRGSLQELVDDINLCEDEEYAKSNHLADLKFDAHKLLIQLNAYMKYLRIKDTTPAPEPITQPAPVKANAPTRPRSPKTPHQPTQKRPERYLTT